MSAKGTYTSCGPCVHSRAAHALASHGRPCGARRRRKRPGRLGLRRMPATLRQRAAQREIGRIARRAHAHVQHAAQRTLAIQRALRPLEQLHALHPRQRLRREHGQLRHAIDINRQRGVVEILRRGHAAQGDDGKHHIGPIARVQPGQRARQRQRVVHPGIAQRAFACHGRRAVEALQALLALARRDHHLRQAGRALIAAIPLIRAALFHAPATPAAPTPARRPALACPVCISNRSFRCATDCKFLSFAGRTAKSGGFSPPRAVSGIFFTARAKPPTCRPHAAHTLP